MKQLKLLLLQIRAIPTNKYDLNVEIESTLENDNDTPSISLEDSENIELLDFENKEYHIIFSDESKTTLVNLIKNKVEEITKIQ